MKTNSYNKKFIYLLLIISLIGSLGVFLLLWNSSSEQKSRPAIIKSNKPFYNPQKLPERTSTQWGALVKKDIKGPIEGKVTIIDWCSKTIFIDNVPFNMGSLDLAGIEMGDRVKVTYTDTNQGKVIESIYVLSEKKSRPAAIKSNKPFYNPQKLPERTSTQGAPLVKKDIKGPVQGKVTTIDWCSRTVFIDDVPFDMGSLDLAGIEMGDPVKVTYTDTNQGKVIESIYVLR
jgi:hypothetical protein